MQTRGRHRDVVQLTRWGVAEIISLDEDNLAAALGQHLSDVRTRALRITVRHLIPSGLSGRTTSLVLRAADVASDGGSAADLSRSLRVSRRTTARWYRRSRLPTPKRLLAWLRLLRAAHVLDETSRSVTHVALACGYASDSNLRTAMTRFLGRAPRALRREGALRTVSSRFQEEVPLRSGQAAPP